MNLGIIEEKENPLFKRRDVLASLDYLGGATPSKAVLQKAIADQYKVSLDTVEIIKILSENGMPKGKVWIKIWQEKKIPVYIEKNAKKEATEEAPKEEPKSEEKKEEPVAEKKEPKE